MFGIKQQYFILAFGVCFFALGLAARFGLWKKWYWSSLSTIYGYTLLGMVFIIYSYNELAVSRLGSYYIIYQGLILFLVIIGIWWSVNPPNFIKPAWVRWVERYPETIYDAIVNAVKADENWKSHMKSFETLDS